MQTLTKISIVTILISDKVYTSNAKNFTGAKRKQRIAIQRVNTAG